MFKSYRIGRIFGFPIDVNLSFLLLLGVAAIWWGGLAGVVFVLIAFGSVLLHELGHALMARQLGVPVSGVELHFFGGAAKMTRQPKSAGDEIAIAAAGPAVSFALGGLGWLLTSLTGSPFFQTFAILNTAIGLFNLLPALPMDGGRILRAILTRRMSFYRATALSVTIARGFSILFAVLGLVSLQLYLVLLAGVLWVMGSAELQLAAHIGYSQGSRFGYTSDVEIMPPGWQPGRRVRGPEQPGQGLAHHWYQPTGGFTVRRTRDGRLVIEPIDSAF